jgi:hypothetical protein
VKKFLSSAAINAGLLVLPFLLLEGALRLLPVAYLPRILPVTAQAPVARFEPNVEYRWSRDWNFSIVTRKRSNNYGFIHAADYHPGERSPLLAVIGDSLVEANQVDAGKSVAELLHAALGAEGRVYSLAISGAPMSQYLAYAEFARDTFRPDAMAFVIAPNDFDESLLKYNGERRFHYFTQDGALQRLDYELSSTKKVLRQSAVLRYVMHNLEAGQRLPALWQSLRGAGASAWSGEALERRLADSYRAVEYFLDQLPGKSGLGRESIVFVLDPWRPAIYSAEAWSRAENGYYGRMPRYFAAQAAARGYEVIDLQPVFIRRRELHGATLEAAPTDSHWSALGHEVVAEELAKSAVFRRAFPGLARFRSVSARPAN